jgi:8-oxo-dGTP diphosphatase
VLLIKEEEEPYRGQWVIPQGDVKAGETVDAAARREVLEELGVEVDLGGLLGVYDDFQGGTLSHSVIVCYLGKVKGPREPRPTSEAIDYAWVDASKGLPGVPSVVRKIMDDIDRRVHRGRRIRW